jgi:hypothetical protein
MSVLPPDADVARHDYDVRLVTNADSYTAANCSLFDPSVFLSQQQQREIDCHR